MMGMKDHLSSIGFGAVQEGAQHYPVAHLIFIDKSFLVIKGTPCGTRAEAMVEMKSMHEKLEETWEKSYGFPWPFDGRIEYMQ